MSKGAYEAYRVRIGLAIRLALIDTPSLGPRDVDDRVDDGVGHVHALRSKFPRQGLAERTHGELARREGGEVGRAPDRGRGARDDQGRGIL